MLVSFLLGMDRSSPTDYLSQLINPSDFQLSRRYHISDVIQVVDPLIFQSLLYHISDVIQMIDPSVFQSSLCYHMSDVIQLIGQVSY